MADPITIKVQEKAQYPWNKHIPLKVTVYLDVDAKSLEILPIASSGYFVPEHKMFPYPHKGTYSASFTYVPVQSGVVNYSVSATVATADTNYADSYSGTLEFNSSLTRIPMSSGYLGYQIGIFVLLLVIGLGLAFGAKKWLYVLKEKTLPQLIDEQTEKGV